MVDGLPLQELGGQSFAHNTVLHLTAIDIRLRELVVLE